MLLALGLATISGLVLLGLWLRECAGHRETRLHLQFSDEKLRTAAAGEEQLRIVFQSLSLDALEKNNRSFIELAKASLEKFQEGAKHDLDKKQTAIAELFTPMRETLQKLDTGFREMEKERKGQQETFREQLRALFENERLLKLETANLVKALRSPIARGRWGEVQLRRVVELAGMLNYCDFYEQQQFSEEESRYRPDMLVRLPGGRQVIIDAKVPLQAYLDAVQTTDDALREMLMKDHARQVKQHVQQLGKKSYWEKFQPTPEFVVLFLPAETFFSAALEYDPSLIEAGAEQKVIIATPTTLIALLRAVAYGWKQENLSAHLEELTTLGQELYKRLSDMVSHFNKMGRGLSSAVEGYNKAMGSLESRVLVTARKFKDLGVTHGQLEIEEIEPVDRIPRVTLSETE